MLSNGALLPDSEADEDPDELLRNEDATDLQYYLSEQMLVAWQAIMVNEVHQDAPVFTEVLRLWKTSRPK